MRFELMCEEVSLESWGELDNGTEKEWTAKFHDWQGTEITVSAITREEPIPGVGIVYYFTMNTSR